MSEFATNDEVKVALAAHREWERQAKPSAKAQPRVFVDDPADPKSRRPFKLDGHWCVRIGGTARLLRPVAGPNDWQVFPLTYSWRD